VQQTQPQQVQYLEAGLAPEAIRGVENAEIAMKAAPFIVDALAPEFLNGSGISPATVIKDSAEAAMNAPDYIAGKFAAAEAERIAQLDQKIAEAPQTRDTRIDNALLAEI